ncbi:hypothetical protein [Amycolatopsis australiensis]|uniref:Uncharacterized protein n=1 Tax=Amycolatopsis australiensis TaxID=546364 RepID=A0A1K1RGJ6_9PSEU|nr:hypothetical protein [Amycolatopsis australiensis]SFW70988.1 hypothetical protein SAMN04489730_3202 [Amycolatopsis australiensis]
MPELLAQAAHRHVQTAVEDLVTAAGAEIIDRDDPITGSWFRRMRAMVRAAASDLARETAVAAAHAIDSHVVLARDATGTATMMQNLARSSERCRRPKTR